MKRERLTIWVPILAFALLALAHPAMAQEPDPAAEPAPVSEPQPAPAEPTAEPAAEPAAPAAAAPEPRQTVAGGAVSAVSETAEQVREGGAEAVRQTRALWSDVLQPLWERLAAAVPGVLKALLVLAAFWLLAILLSLAVRKLLGMTHLDEKAATAWGMGGLLTAKDGTRRSVEQLAGTAVKWLVLLFGFVAFFQALDLSMVAGPLQGIVDRIVGVIPNVLQAAVILLIYWVVASLLKLVVSRGLAAAGFDQRAARFIPEREIKGEKVGPSGLVGRLIFYVVLLFGLPPFLDALGQRSLVAPLSEMLEKTLAFLPNIVGAVVIFFLGHLIATIVREIVSNFLAAAGADAGARKLGLGGSLEKLKVSEILGSVVYFFIIIPVLAAAVDSLGIRAISEPISRTLETLLAAVPLVFVATLVVGVGYFLARVVRGIVESFLRGVGFDGWPEKLGMPFLSKKGGLSPSSVIGTVVMAVIILLTAEQALATLKLEQLSQLIGRLIAYLPQLVIGLVMLLAAWALAAWAARLVEAALGERPQARLLSLVTRWAILVFGAGIALLELGIGEGLISVVVAAIVGGAALALGLAFGLGGRDRAKQWIDELDTGS